MIRLLSKPHLLARIALFGTFFVKFFDHMFAYALKIFQKSCSKIINFFKQSKFRKKSIKICSKRSLTLLELFISLSLTLLIFTTLTYFYQQIVSIGSVMDRIQGENFQIRYVENRLNRVFPRSVSSSDPKIPFHFFSTTDRGGLFKSGSPSLIFVFDNGVQHQKEMSYLVIGRLFLDVNNRLILATWPIEERWKEGESPPVFFEVLLEGVSSLSFSFYIPPNKGKTEENKSHEKIWARIPLDVQGGWWPEWKKEYHQLPAMIKVIVKKKKQRGDGEEEEETFIFAYPFPATLQPITYDI